MSDFDDVLVGNAKRNLLIGGRGDDMLFLVLRAMIFCMVLRAIISFLEEVERYLCYK
ncbi:hypothetical protein [Avibacterium paragallinarum]|uniref:hypothetical protein n=1 Tax=Avibacterium paragallinarum TaxID=728 RepID=UPI001FD64C86|nr:hypothetical protein [Avibacterium paragallinarum]